MVVVVVPPVDDGCDGERDVCLVAGGVLAGGVESISMVAVGFLKTAQKVELRWVEMVLKTAPGKGKRGNSREKRCAVPVSPFLQLASRCSAQVFRH